ncbi:hypothetical protein CaCOL14_006102 [Colletotrichum acutatum]|uniref:Uncharacterized protein n=1 Tax=Glomerella acutata TaxID=27357 RepID=A0AAD8UEH2_GLOAC|nr:uncharacterized protein BDZ83DRAFT_755243 [Colletotrichum acutatum]KAK1719414.1 hypothetical protein BDZ83DRAFT_755243 [Colletotrichum acutatum]
MAEVYLNDARLLKSFSSVSNRPIDTSLQQQHQMESKDPIARSPKYQTTPTDIRLHGTPLYRRHIVPSIIAQRNPTAPPLISSGPTGSAIVEAGERHNDPHTPSAQSSRNKLGAHHHFEQRE